MTGRNARALLTDDATYCTPEATNPEYDIDCRTPDAIVDLMASIKGQVPDIQVVAWAEQGDHVLTRLRQPDWGADSDWWQVLTVREDRVARLVDYATEESALARQSVDEEPFERVDVADRRVRNGRT